MEVESTDSSDQSSNENVNQNFDIEIHQRFPDTVLYNIFENLPFWPYCKEFCMNSEALFLNAHKSNYDLKLGQKISVSNLPQLKVKGPNWYIVGLYCDSKCVKVLNGDTYDWTYLDADGLQVVDFGKVFCEKSGPYLVDYDIEKGKPVVKKMSIRLVNSGIFMSALGWFDNLEDGKFYSAKENLTFALESEAQEWLDKILALKPGDKIEFFEPCNQGVNKTKKRSTSNSAFVEQVFVTKESCDLTPNWLIEDKCKKPFTFRKKGATNFSSLDGIKKITPAAQTTFYSCKEVVYQPGEW
jgi:hypothetical protein